MKPHLYFTLILLLLFSGINLFTLEKYTASAETATAYKVIGAENFNYSLNLKFIKRYQSFTLDDEKISFYMLGCNMISDSEARKEMIIKDEEKGAKLIFIAPEAGRKSGIYITKDFYAYANSILRVKNVDKIIFEKKDGQWKIILGENKVDADIYIEEKNGSSNEKLNNTASNSKPFIIDLANYTISREGGEFEMIHNFAPSAPIRKAGFGSITFHSNEIMLRTFETRLSEPSSKGEIKVDRKLSRAIIGNIIRFTGDSEDGDNIAIVNGMDEDKNIIHIARVNQTSYNTHPAGTWLRCYSDYSRGQVYENEYPKVNLEPSLWVVTHDQFNKLFNDLVVKNDVTGLLKEISFDFDDSTSFGYSLRDVTYSCDGLNFTGGLNGAIDLGFKLDFFGWKMNVGPAHIDYGSLSTTITDQILRINTYKREAFRLYFNPKFLQSYNDWGKLPNPPDVFPLTFRIYFDKAFDLIGGNIRLNLPGDGIILPGGLARVDNIGGGYTVPATFEIDAIFKSAGLDEITGTRVSFWDADVETVLALDRSYITMDGKIWMWGGKFQVGKLSSIIAWNYYKGKRFKGLEFKGETGVGLGKKIELVITMGFKIKRYKSSGKTKFYIGGRGQADIKAFGASFSGIGVKVTSKKFTAYVNPPGPIGPKKLTVYFKNITRSVNTAYEDTGIARITDGDGYKIILMPEAKRVYQPRVINAATSSGTSLNLPDYSKNAAITINYEGDLSNIMVSMPDGSNREVIIADENTVNDPTKLYAMNYELSDTEKQLYIELTNASAGNYTVSYTADTVNDTAIYTIDEIPQIDTNGVTASYSNGIADLSWDLEDIVTGDTRYHLSLQNINNGEVVKEYPIYDTKFEDTDEGEDEISATKKEVFIDQAAITKIGTHVSTRIKLPDNLPTGTYAFVVEPVLNKADGEEDLLGKEVTSNTFTHTNTVYSSIVSSPENIMIENTGNGITRVMWDFDPTVYSWDVAVKDSSGSIAGKASVLASELIAGKNLYIDPLSAKSRVYINFSLGSNPVATAVLTEGKYDTDYKFSVTAVQRQPYTVGDYYNSTFGYIDMNSMEADNNESFLIYTASSENYSGRFIKSEGIKFYAEIRDNTKDKPLFSANLFEENTGTPGYDYNLDSDLDLESLRSINPGALVLRTNAMDAVRLVPDHPVKKFGIAMTSPSGKELINIPALSLEEFTTPGNWTSILSSLSKDQPELANNTELTNTLLNIYNANAITLSENQDADQITEQVKNIDIDFSKLQRAGILSSFETGKYTVSITAENQNNDETRTDFKINIQSIPAAPFIESVTKEADSKHRITGYANGAETITLNGTKAELQDGYFDLTTKLNSKDISYEMDDEFGNHYSGTLSFDEYEDYMDANKNDSIGTTCFIAVCID